MLKLIENKTSTTINLLCQIHECTGDERIHPKSVQHPDESQRMMLLQSK